MKVRSIIFKMNNTCHRRFEICLKEGLFIANAEPSYTKLRQPISLASSCFCLLLNTKHRRLFVLTFLGTESIWNKVASLCIKLKWTAKLVLRLWIWEKKKNDKRMWHCHVPADTLRSSIQSGCATSVCESLRPRLWTFTPTPNLKRGTLQNVQYILKLKYYFNP